MKPKNRLYGFEENWEDSIMHLVNEDTLQEAVEKFVEYIIKIPKYASYTYKIERGTMFTYLQAKRENGQNAFSYLIYTYILKPGVITDIGTYE